MAQSAPLHPRARRARSRSGPAALAVGLATLAGALLPSCGTDNPACIFGPGTCFGGGVGLGGNPAFLPESGQLVRDGAPSIEMITPTGSGVSTTTPIVVAFSESVAASTVSSASFSLIETSSGIPVSLVTQVLADGQIAVLLPTTTTQGMDPLMPGFTYQLSYNDSGLPITDVTGQELESATGSLGTFTVTSVMGEPPSVVRTFPEANIARAPVTSEIVVVFDAPVDPTTVGPQNLVALVDGTPLNSPSAPFQPIAVTTPFGGGAATDTRVYTFRQFDGDGNPALLKNPGDAGQVEVRISSAMGGIEDFDDNVVDPVTVEFTLSDLFPPAAAMIVSQPTNAIGIANLLDPMGGEGDLAIDVSLVEGLMDDQVDALLTGTSINDPTLLVALLRPSMLAMDINTTTFGAFDLELSSSQDSLEPVFQDGEIAIAFRQQRGTEVSPLLVLDAEPDIAGLQDPVFDTTRPEIVGLGLDGTETTVFRSRFRDLTLVGRASEILRSVGVTVDVGGMMFDNGMTPPVVGASSNSLTQGPMADPEFLFVAAPVELPGSGVLDPADGPRPMTIQLLDRALNESLVQLQADFEQRGSTSPGAALAGPSFTVEVFDQQTLRPIEAALVVSHQDDAGTVTPLTMPLGTLTDASGIATGVPAAAMGDTIVTVDADGYDLFTLHGVATDRISIPLRRTEALAFNQGLVSVLTEQLAFSSLNRQGSDSRSVDSGDVVGPLDICLNTGQEVTCSGSFVIRTGVLGAGSTVGSTFPSSIATYSAQSFLRAFELQVPAEPAFLGQSSSIPIEIEFLLDDPLLDDEELGIDWTPQPILDPTTATGIDLMMLDGDPEVAVQANIPGIDSSVTVGLGVAFDDGMGAFDVRAAYAGAVDTVQDSMTDELGSLIESGVVEPVLRLRTEISEPGTLFVLPNAPGVSIETAPRAGARPRLDQMEMTLRPLGVPTVQAPLPTDFTGGEDFDIVVDGVIDTSVTGAGRRGLYVAEMFVGNGRRWKIFRPDQNNAPGGSVRLHAPDLSVFNGGTGAFPDEPIALQVSAYAWESFDLTDFFWSDLLREYELFGHAPLTAFNPVP